MNAAYSREYLQESSGYLHSLAFQTAAISGIYGVSPAYAAFSPPILGKRHVWLPDTLAEQQAIRLKSWPNLATADTDLARIGGSYPEYTAHMPSTSR